jgi:hypothetical protein
VTGPSRNGLLPVTALSLPLLDPLIGCKGGLCAAHGRAAEAVDHPSTGRQRASLSALQKAQAILFRTRAQITHVVERSLSQEQLATWPLLSASWHVALRAMQHAAWSEGAASIRQRTTRRWKDRFQLIERARLARRAFASADATAVTLRETISALERRAIHALDVQAPKVLLERSAAFAAYVSAAEKLQRSGPLRVDHDRTATRSRTSHVPRPQYARDTGSRRSS